MSLHLAKFQTGAPSVVVTPEAMPAFQRDEPYGYVLDAVHRSIKVGDRYFTLAADCPDDGYAEWTGALTPEEQAREDKVMLLPADLREYAFPGFKTRVERIAQKQADDAAADERARLAAESKAELAAEAEVVKG